MKKENGKIEAMLSIAHVATAGLIVTKVPNPVIAGSLILLSHYIGDWLPHWDVGTGLSKGSRKRRDAFIMELVDLGLTAGLVWWWWQKGNPEPVWPVYWAGLWSLVPDFMEAPRNFLKWEPKWLKPFNDFHGKWHHSIQNIWQGVSWQIVWLGLIYYLK